MNRIETYSATNEDPAEIPSARAGEALSPSAAWDSSPRFSWLVLGLIALLYVGTCFTPVVFDDNEGLYAGAVREMHQSGNWLVPTSNGFPRLQKPPLVYWTMLISTSILGESEFALRLPNALATVGWIIATYLITRRLGSERFGVATAVTLASMVGVWVFNHLIQPEPFLACFISLAFWCLVEARFVARPGGDRWYLLFWIFLALGTLSKGLHGALWPLGTVLLTAVFVPSWRPWLRPTFSPGGILAFTLLVVPWYAYMVSNFPHFLSAHFVNEQLGACLNTRYPPDARQLPLAQFYGQHFVFWMPWTLLLPAAIAAALQGRRAFYEQPARFHPEIDVIKLLACWFLLTMVSVAFSTRQDYYSMCCWGVVAAFVALPWMSGRFSFLHLARAWFLTPCLVLAAAGVASLGLVLWIRPQLGSLGAVTATPIRERDTFMDAIAGISPALWAQFITLLAIFGAVFAVAGTIATVLAWRRRNGPALLVLASAMAAPVCLAAAGFTIMSPYFSLAESARAINRELALEPGAVVACEALPHTASSLLYYLNARPHWVNAPFNEQYAQRVLGLGHDYYWDEPALLTTWHSSHPVYLIIDEDRLPYWQSQLGADVRTLDKSGTRLVLCNRPAP